MTVPRQPLDSAPRRKGERVASGRRRNRDEEVVQAAISIFSRKGYADASVQDLADEVGVLKGSLYHYISSKEDLLMRVFERAHVQAIENIAWAAALDVGPLERFRCYFERHVLWYLENLEHAGVFFHEWQSLTGENYEIVRARRRTYQRFIEGMVLACRDGGLVPADIDVRHVLSFVLSAVNAAPDWYRREGPDRPEDIAAAYADLAVGALIGAPAPPASRPEAPV